MSSKLQVDPTQRGIWQYHFYYPPLEEKFRLSLGEGQTAIEKYEGIFFKREDQNPTGSFKDRGLAYQISWAYEQGFNDLVLSTSGNAGIAAAAYCQLVKIKLHVFVSPAVNHAKLAKIKQFGCQIKITSRPVSGAVKFAKTNQFFNLRPSQQKEGFEGYKSIAFEIHQNQGKIDSLFIPVSSGTALVGVAEGFKFLDYLPQLHLVQTTAVCPMARIFDKDYLATKTSMAEALVAKVTPRKEEVISLVKQSGGGGWVVSDEQIMEAEKSLERWGIKTSAEGAAAFAGIWKARKKGKNLGKKVVCLLTGKKI